MGSLDTVQQEQLRAIGSYLNQIRQEQARSLEEISAKTYIPMRLLKAIEAGQDKTLPEPVFIQGFIRRYADALGLDGVDLSQRFPIHVTPLPVMAAVSGNREKLREPRHTSRVSLIDEDEQSPRSLPFANFPYIAAAALLALGGIALAVVWGLSSRKPSSQNQATVVLPKQPSLPQASPSASVSPTVSPSISPKATLASPVPPATPKAQVKPASPTVSPTVSPTSRSTTTASPSAAATVDRSAPVRVELNLSDESWVQVIVDGQVKTEAILPKGTRQSWSGKQEITIITGNAGAVSVTQNGGSPKKMGALGDVSEMTFKPQTSN